MKKILKLIGKIIGGLIGLIVIAIVTVMAIGYFRFNKTYEIAVPPLELPTDDASLARGEHLVQAVTHCGYCHGAELAGGQVSPSSPLGPNLTPGGEPGFWDEGTFFNVIRTGKHPSGRELDPVMPWKFFRNMTDSELRAIRAYLLSLPKLENVMP